MREALINKSYVVKVKPLTPTHVWSGRRLIFGFDLVKRGDKVCVVDFENIPEEAVKELSSSKPEDFPIVLKRYMDSVPCSGEYRYDSQPPPNASVNDIAVEIIPGSSLKGYIRTTILYSLLGDKTPQKVKDILSSTVDLSKDPKDVAQGLEAFFFRKPRLRKQGGFVDSLQQLLVSDPEVNVDNDCLRVMEFRVYEIPSMKQIASQYVVAVTCGELKYNVRILNPPSISSIARGLDEFKQIIDKLTFNPQLLLNSLRKFGCELLDYELNRISGIKELEYYRRELEEYKKKYCVENRNCTIAKLGYMAGLASKTVIKLVKQHDPSLYRSIVNKMVQYVKHSWDELTIKLAVIKRDSGTLLEGVGWCEICLNESTS